MKLGKLYGVGIGPGDPQYLTLRAVDVLKSADVIFTVISKNAEDSVSGEVVRSLEPKGEMSMLIFSMSRNNDERQAQIDENAEVILKRLEEGKNCAFATLGDPTTYSTFVYIVQRILQKYPDLDYEIVPGITSFATLAAKAKVSLVENREMLRVIPSFRADDVEKIEFPENSTTILLKTYRTREALIKLLRKEEEKSPIKQIVYGEELGMEDQRIVYSLDEIEKLPPKYLSMIMVKK